MGRFKIWEVLLFAAVILLAALVYEAHNDGGRYVSLKFNEHGTAVQDTRTGKIWVLDFDTKTWKVLYPAIPKGL